MIYRIHRPAPPLSRYVEFFWFFEGLFPDYATERVLPQGCFELVIDLRETPRKWFSDEGRDEWREYRGGWLSGTHGKYLVIDVLPNSSMIGAHFRLGGAAAFLPFASNLLTDRVEHLEDIWGSSSLEIRETLLNLATPERKFAALEAFLLQKLRARGGDRLDGALAQLFSNPNLHSIAQLAQESGISHKQFIAQFRGRVGLTPKHFCRIRRFQSALSEIERSRRVNWAGLAAETGYYDQAHFIRDFTGFSGLKPSSYLTARGEHLNFVPMESR
jgi:AraC-like DNA-binding protein